MNALLQQLAHWSTAIPDAVALEGAAGRLSYAELWRQVTTRSAALRVNPARHIGLLLDNSPSWVVMQLAAFHAGIPVTPIPTFFSASQQRHALDQSGVDLLFCSQRYQDRLREWGFSAASATDALAWRRDCAPGQLPPGTRLVTFTSGSTGHPKGVCLGDVALSRVCRALYQRIDTGQIQTHACLLPLPVLLENLAGVLLPLYAGSRCLIYDSEHTGLPGSNRLDLQRLGAFLHRHQPDSLIVTPELLKAVVGLCRAGLSPHPFKLLAVGGARVSTALLHQADALGLPVMEGYGLSECASVVALNGPDQHRLGSCGRPLDHCKVRIDSNGEVLVDGAGMLGYVGTETAAPAPIRTGDLGYLDEAGFLHIQGRVSNLYINSFGRNFSPEWVEAEFAALPQLLQICVVGDGRPYNIALILPAPGVTQEALDHAFDAVNATLPDYARVQQWLPITEPFGTHNQQLTANGRLRRNQIMTAYSTAIDALYATEESYDYAIL